MKEHRGDTDERSISISQYCGMGFDGLYNFAVNGGLVSQQGQARYPATLPWKWTATTRSTWS